MLIQSDTYSYKITMIFFPQLQISVYFMQTSNTLEKCNAVMPGQEHLNCINFVIADFFFAFLLIPNELVISP